MLAFAVFAFGEIVMTIRKGLSLAGRHGTPRIIVVGIVRSPPSLPISTDKDTQKQLVVFPYACYKYWLEEPGRHGSLRTIVLGIVLSLPSLPGRHGTLRKVT
jgi:hypothetical protein